MPLQNGNSKRSACIPKSYALDPRHIAPPLVQPLTIRIPPHHHQWLAQQAPTASRSTVIRLLIQQAIDSQPQQQATTNAR